MTRAPHGRFGRILATACATTCTAAAATLGACTIETTDGDLVWVPPTMAVEKMNESRGVFQTPTNGVFIDPRSPKQFEEGHIPNAINLPLPDMEETAAIVLADYNLFIVYDANFNDLMAKAGSKRLIELGYKNVYTLEGGLKSWKEDGYEVAKGPAKKPDAAQAGATAGTAGGTQ